MIFQWGPNSGIANSSHCYGLMSSKLQNSSHYSPMEWYFNGALSLPFLSLHIAMALWVQKCKILASKASWNDVSMGQTPALLILHIDMALWVQNCKTPATTTQWNDILMGSKDHSSCHGGMKFAIWTHKAISIRRIGNATVWTQLKYHSRRL